MSLSGKCGRVIIIDGFLIFLCSCVFVVRFNPRLSRSSLSLRARSLFVRGETLANILSATASFRSGLDIIVGLIRGETAADVLRISDDF